MPKDSAPASCKLALWQVIEWLCANARFFQCLCPMRLHFKLSLAEEKKLSSRSSIYWKDYIGMPCVWPNFLLCLLPHVLPPSSHSVFSGHWSSLRATWPSFPQDLCTCCPSPVSTCFLFFIPDYPWLLSQISTSTSPSPRSFPRCPGLEKVALLRFPWQPVFLQSRVCL